LLVLLLVPGWQPRPELPAQEPDQVRRILEDDRYDWVTMGTGLVQIHFPAGSYAETQRHLLPARAEEARRTVLERLSVPEFPEPVHVFYVDGRHDMEELTGSPVRGFAYPDDYAIVVVLNDRWRAFERHEMAHVVTLGSWPRPGGPAVVEGLATYVDGVCGGYENGRIARTILDQGLLLPLETLAGEFRRQDDLIAYLQAATLVEHLVYLHGPGAIGALWNQGLGAAPALLQTSAGDFLEGYESWLASTYGPLPAVAWQSIRKDGCGVEARGAD